jgi:hypothetical protein
LFAMERWLFVVSCIDLNSTIYILCLDNCLLILIAITIVYYW